jgi:hypothetical protein
MRLRLSSGGQAAAACTLALLAANLLHAAGPFDFDNGNAPVEVIIPALAPIIFSDVSPSGSDATLVLRVTTLVTNSWFDASAPYHPTAVGVYSRLGRRPEAERTTRNINTACLFATYRVMNSLLPKRNAEWRTMLASVGLDPDNNVTDDTPAGIGNRAGSAVVLYRENDGMNQLGNADGTNFNRVPYADYTGYEPVNTANTLRDPSRWQPRTVSSGNGIFRIQQFVTPQYALTRPYSLITPAPYRAPRPSASSPTGPGGRRAYEAQVDEVLQASANLTDYQKMSAELFNNKIYSLGFSAVFAALSRGLSLMDFIHLDFLTNVAAFDTGIAVWSEKRRWDAVRPFSAIRHVYGNRLVRAWGGSGLGTVDLPASQWKEYLDVADHPEYPSGSSSFCAAHAESARRFLESDSLNWAVTRPAGSSVVEPGVTPANEITLGPWATWTEFETECGLSRLWGGVHFMAAIEEGKPLGKAIGEQAYWFVKGHIDGAVGALPQL